MVSVTLIIESFEHVVKGIFLIMECLLGNDTFFLISLLWFTWFPYEWVTLEKRVATRGSPSRVIVPFPHILTTFHTSTPSLPHILGFQAY
jgi:hypothetical protein